MGNGWRLDLQRDRTPFLPCEEVPPLIGLIRPFGEDEMAEKLIVSDPAVMRGKPVVAGTRITVELIIEKLAAGETVEQIIEAHPRLTRQAIQAALAFAAEALQADVVYPTT